MIPLTINPITANVVRKSSDESEKAPPYRVVFVDEKGGRVDYPVFYLSVTSDMSDKDKKDRLIQLGSQLKHIWHATIGKDTELPKAETPKELVDSVMEAVDKYLQEHPDEKYKIVTNYGSKSYPQEYLRVKKFPAFMEKASVDPKKSDLRNSPNDLMKRPDFDEEENTDVAAPSSEKNEDWLNA